MDRLYLGIDTSNYTTSACIYNLTKDEMVNRRVLLTVNDGELGLRQNDAVFQHVNNLPSIIEDLLYTTNGEIVGYGVSDKPRNMENSYMPCFKVGVAFCKTLASTNKMRVNRFTHQQGHIMSALYSIKKQDMVKEDFLAFHVSGGTTDLVLCSSKESFLNCTLIGTSLDLHAGQLIDRVGLKLGLSFPCGPALEELALKCNDDIECETTIKGYDCSLSGIENKVEELIKDGLSKEYIAKYTLICVAESLYLMVTKSHKLYGKLPIIFSGGVMSNNLIIKYLHEQIYDKVYFSTRAYATDNAAGIAYLTYLKEKETENNKQIIIDAIKDKVNKNGNY